MKLINDRGMAYQGSGTGGILLIESTIVPNGKGRLYLTGSLGDVIRESAELALTWVKSGAADLGIDDPLKDVDVHVSLVSPPGEHVLIIYSCIFPLEL